MTPHPRADAGPRPAALSARRSPIGGRFWRRNATGWGLMLPYIIYFCLFTSFPIGLAVYLTFHRWNNLYAPPLPNGLRNYTYLLGDAQFWNALRVTLIFVVVFTVVIVPLALALAVALNRAIAGRTFFRAAFFMPYITPGVVVAIIFIWLLQTQDGILTDAGWYPEPPAGHGGPSPRSVVVRRGPGHALHRPAGGLEAGRVLHRDLPGGLAGHPAAAL
jgi:ABC-type Fe3+ transport system permease subunit